MDDDIRSKIAFTCIFLISTFDRIPSYYIFTLQHRYSEESFRPMLFLDMGYSFNLDILSIYCAQNCFFLQEIADISSRHRFPVRQLYVSV